MGCICSACGGPREDSPLLEGFDPEKPRPERTVLFIIGRGGAGHKASAKAVQAALVTAGHAWAHEIEMVDMGHLYEACLSGRAPNKEAFGPDDGYNWLMKHGCYRLAGISGPIAMCCARLNRAKLEAGLEKFWRQRRPDAVVSFVPYFNTMMRASLLRACPLAPIFTVVTDMESSRSGHLWIGPYDEADGTNHVVVVGTSQLQVGVGQMPTCSPTPHARTAAARRLTPQLCCSEA